MNKKIKVGIIGGSGLDDPKFLNDLNRQTIETPFGKPASDLASGFIGNTEVVILARHGRNHSLMPSLVPYQANIWALKQVGCTHILATTACGSLQEKYEPGHIVLIDQFIDFTKHRNLTFYHDQVVHTSMADPFCLQLRQSLATTAEKLAIKHHKQGTIVTIEGPRFSTRAESKMFQNLGADIINMSTVPEVTLARELGICYQSIAMVTDYDCWRANEKPVTWEIVLEQMNKNVEHISRLLLAAIPNIDFYSCSCRKVE